MTDAVLLIRAKTGDDATLSLAADLERVSGCESVLVLDERDRVQPSGSFRKVGLREAAAAELGLYCPPDFAWRCGDYAVYLAAHQLSPFAHYWLVENDVRIYGEDPASFFRFFAARPEVDALAGGFREAEPAWFWQRSCRGRDVRPFRCFFPVVRLSHAAVMLLRAKRQSQSRSRLRRRLWPNDEGFVATTVGNSGLRYADLNGFGQEFYREETFAYRHADAAVIAEARHAERGPARLIHPVRPPAELQARGEKIVRDDKRTIRSRLERRMVAAAVERLPW